MAESDRRGLSITAAVVALLGAIGLSFLFYWTVGFPANVPLAFGSAVVLTEIVEIILRGGSAGLSGGGLLKAVYHGVLTAVGCWAGVWVAEALGWIG